MMDGAIVLDPLGAPHGLDSWSGIGHFAIGMARRVTIFSSPATMTAVGV
jgi:hypothetical protein